MQSKRITKAKTQPQPLPERKIKRVTHIDITVNNPITAKGVLLGGAIAIATIWLIGLLQ